MLQRRSTRVTATHLLALLGACFASKLSDNCRDRLHQPFSSTSIWNTAIGSDAAFVPANLYKVPDVPPGTDACTVGKQDPSARVGCPGWKPAWTVADCLDAGCCYDPHPAPDPRGFPWCYANASLGGPGRFYVDIDYFITASEDDPQDVPFVDQGWWGDDPECHRDHCCRKQSSQVVGTLPFPSNWTVNMTSNNAAALLMPDRETLVQFQPLVRCEVGGPLFALPTWRRAHPLLNITVPQNLSILGEGAWGAHGGSFLSSIGGTIRKGELLPDAGPIPHALKLMLWAQEYYFPGNDTVPCFRWPALNCDGNWNASRDPTNSNFYNGSDPRLKPGALLAVPQGISALLQDTMRTVVGAKILQALTDYGGYLDDNTASNSGAFNVEGGVIEEVAEAYDGLSLSPVEAGQPLYEDLVGIYRQLHIVDNNANSTKGGGGTPRVAPAPPICPV